MYFYHLYHSAGTFVLSPKVSAHTGTLDLAPPCILRVPTQAAFPPLLQIFRLFAVFFPSAFTLSRSFLLLKNSSPTLCFPPFSFLSQASQRDGHPSCIPIHNVFNPSPPLNRETPRPRGPACC